LKIVNITSKTYQMEIETIVETSVAEASISSSSSPVLGRWTLVKILGSGATSKVFLGVDQTTGKEAAVKIFKPENQYSFQLMKAESEILQNVSHSNVLSFIESYDATDFYDPTTGETKSVSALVMEYANRGELFDYLGENQYFAEGVAREFFQQLIDAISHLHSKNIAHRDIKLENILLDSRLNIKLADLGYSSYFNPRKLYKQRVGTSSYFAPEIHANLTFSVEKADLFAAGIVLFTLVAGHMPFASATKEDQMYNLIIQNQQDNFWRFHQKMMKKKDENFKFSKDFISMMDKMFDLNPKNRLTLQEIKNHPWMTGVKTVKTDSE
jgi:serine/threonine protein kinase